MWLRNAGYYTAMVGKYLNGYSNQPRMPFGWAEWYATNFNDQDVYNYRLNENGTIVHYGEDAADFKQDVLTRTAADFVNRRAPKAQPFFLWLNYTAPHEGNWGGAPRITAPGSPRSRRPATLTRSSPSRCPGPRTSTRLTSPTSRPRSATAPCLDRIGSRTLSACIAVSWGRCARSMRVSRTSSGRWWRMASSATRWSSTPRTTDSSTASTGCQCSSATSTRSRSGCRS